MARLLAAAVIALSGVIAARGEEPGWQFSPLAGEGDRAALGCTKDSTSTSYTCLVVRCEDDFSVGLHIHTSRLGGGAGRWDLSLDKDTVPLVAVPDQSPYGTRAEGDLPRILDGLEQGLVAYLDPADGTPGNVSYIPLEGSLKTIRQALYFCAPRVEQGQPTPADVVPPVPQERPAQVER